MSQIKNYIFISTMLIMLFGLSGCGNDTTVDYGRLQFCVTFNGDLIQNASVALASSQKDLDSGDYLREVFSDLDGIANFGAVSSGVYYYHSYKYINNNKTYLYISSTVEVKSGHKLDIDVELKEKK